MLLPGQGGLTHCLDSTGISPQLFSLVQILIRLSVPSPQLTEQVHLVQADNTTNIQRSGNFNYKLMFFRL